jgi:hypothetical protein
MKKALIVPMPDINDGKPWLDRSVLTVELDYDRAIAGEAFRSPVGDSGSDVQVYWPSLQVRAARLMAE